MSRYRRKKVAKKKARRKVTKKKITKVLSEKEINDYAKRIEDYYEKRGNDLSKQKAFIESAKRFAEGDIFNMYYSGWHDNGRILVPEYYYDDVSHKETNIPVKFKVVYVDSEGFPHYTRISENGSHSRHINSLADNVQEMIYDEVHMDSKIDVTMMFQLDPEFLDATLLCDEDYDPLAPLRKVHEENEAELREKCENWWKLKELNEAYRVYTGSERGRKSFRKKYGVGDVVYSEQHGKLTIKLAQDDIMVMHDGANIIAFDDVLLKNTTFYREEPKSLYIDVCYDTLKQYKPKKSKTESK